MRRSIIEPGQNANHEFSHRWIVIEFISIIFWPLHGASINQQSIFWAFQMSLLLLRAFSSAIRWADYFWWPVKPSCIFNNSRTQRWWISHEFISNNIQEIDGSYHWRVINKRVSVFIPFFSIQKPFEHFVQKIFEFIFFVHF